MNGFLVTFFTKQDARHGPAHLHDWLMRTAKSMGITGSTAVTGVEGYGHHGKRHSAHFFELTDQPIEVQMAMTQEQALKFFCLLESEKIDVFYVKAPVEFGRTGQADPE